jgi:phage shock protein A
MNGAVMRLIKRISTTVSSTLDKAVSKVENHDAIINAALRETQQAAARSRVRLVRVQKDGNNLKTRRDELRKAVLQWTDRAKSIAASDEPKALECLRRRKECETQATGLEASIDKHRELEDRVTENLKKIEARIGEVSHQRNMMRSRQSVAEATRIINNIEGVSYGEIEDTFDRWEINVGETEIMHGSGASTDSLESAFLVEEDSEALRAELALLVNKDEEEK